jgi:tetratricopeptide (TPR) repeat protein
LIAAFVPPNLYLSQYVTNEPLAGLLTTVAIYLCLRALRSEKEGLWRPLGIGAALGAAMLTKFSVLLALPFFPVALSQKAEGRRQTGEIRGQRSEVGDQSSEARHLPSSIANRKSQIANRKWDWFRSVGAVAVGCLIVCGWHYGRVWARFGKPIVVNQGDTELWHAWWQDPGFRTSAFYFSFGRALTSPSFSAFHSFADGIYSTLWGDGLGSGVADQNLTPPWNYDLAGAGYWISLGVSLLLVIGVALTLAKLARRIQAEWFLMLGIVFLFGFGLLWNTLQAPYFCSVKAFYAFPALLPFSALIALGWDWLRRRHRFAGVAAWVLLLAWSMTAYTSFWIRSGNPQTQLVRAMELGAAFVRQGKLDEAIGQYRLAAGLKPDFAGAHYNLGTALLMKGQTDEASGQYLEAIRLKPDFAEAYTTLGNLAGTFDGQGRYAEAIRFYEAALKAQPDQEGLLNNLAWLLASCPEAAFRNGREAVRLAKRACELTGYTKPLLLGTLAAAQAEAGDFQAAIATAERATALATSLHLEDVAARNRELIQLYRQGQPFHEKKRGE